METIAKKKISRFDIGEGRPVEIQDRDLEFLRFIFDLGYASSALIHDYVCPDIQQDTVGKRLKKLKDAPNKYLGIHETQRTDNERARCSHVIYSLTEKGIQLLLRAGRVTEQEIAWRPRVLISSSSFWHDVNCANTIGSIRIAIKKDPTLEFISPFQILAKAPVATQIAKEPLTFDLRPIGGKTRWAIPDYLFGILRKGQGVRFFWFEQDQKSESIKRNKSKGISMVKKLLNCEEVLTSGAYRSQLGIPDLYIMTATVSRTHLKNIKEELSLQRTTRFLFKAIELPFGQGKVPMPVPHVLTEPWELIGHSPLNISE